MREVVGFGAGGDGGFPERIIFVVGGDGSGGVNVFRNVPVAIECREIGASAVGDSKQSADSARALHAS